MTKKLISIIREEIEKAIKMFPVLVLEQELNALPNLPMPGTDDPTGMEQQNLGGTDPGADPGGDQLDDLAGENQPEDEPEQSEEEDLDPVDKSLNDLKDIAKATDDVAVIVMAIKGLAQDMFATPDSPDETKPNISDLFQKIRDDDAPETNLIKKALGRPELNFLNPNVITSIEDSGED